MSGTATAHIFATSHEHTQYIYICIYVEREGKKEIKGLSPLAEDLSVRVIWLTSLEANTWIDRKLEDQG